MRNLFLVCLSFVSCVVSAQDNRLYTHEKGIWSIEGTDKHDRWVIIHGLTKSIGSGIFHIEVIAREKSAPKWDIERLVNHLAITEKALKSSIIKPLNSGSVYPEPFDNAYDQWLKSNSGKGGVVCSTSVIKCMGDK